MRNNVPWIVGGIVAVVLICCGGFVAIGVMSDPPANTDPPITEAAAPTPQQTVEPEPAEDTDPVDTPTPESTFTPKTVSMPKLVGMNAAVAEDKLLKLGFPSENIKLGTQDTNDTWVLLPENWTVTKQSTKAGAKVSTDTMIALTCTKER